MVKTNLDISRVPEEPSAPWIKRFFKHHFGIPVYVQSKGYVSIHTRSHEFPENLGQMCLTVVYGEDFEGRWADNVHKTMISLLRKEWKLVFQKIIDGELTKE